MKFQRKKGRNILLSFFYKFHKILPFSKRGKLKLYLDLEWIFDRLAHEQSFRVFGERSHPVRIRSADFLLHHLSPSDDVLDIGCNSGDLTFLLSKKVKSITGIDYDMRLIETAKKKYRESNISFVARDAIGYLETNNRTFDAIILSHIVEHLDQPGLLLDLAKKYCRQVYIEVPDWERTHLNVYRKELSSSLIYSDADHIWEFDRQELLDLIASHGLVVEDSEFVFGVQKYWCKII